MTSAYEQGNVPPIEVKHRLRIAREFAGLDQDQLAERSGVSRATISKIENGVAGEPRRTTINALALACGVPASWIREGRDRDGHGPDGGGHPLDPETPDLPVRRPDAPVIDIDARRPHIAPRKRVA